MEKLLKNHVLNSLLDDDFHRSHLAEKGYLGAGMIYYALVYSFQAKTCVCLGSGGGFVPCVVRQAQHDAGVEDGITILIDANMPEAGWGKPDYHGKENTFLDRMDISLITATTENALKALNGTKIDYLHIDADHSYRWARHDLSEYSKLMGHRGIITMHDSYVREGNAGVWDVVEEAKENGFEVVNLPVSLGVAILRKG